MDTASLARELSEASLRIQRRSRQEENIHGLTGARLAVLRRLMAEGPVALGDLAAAERVKKATMTRMVTAMEDEKLVIRRKSSRDKRVVEVMPTSLGRTLAWSAERRRLHWLEAILDRLSKQQRGTIGRAAQILSEHLEIDRTTR